MTLLERRAIKEARRYKHIKELQKLGYTKETMHSLKRLENSMNYWATMACNGEMSDIELESKILYTTNKIKELFGGGLPDNFFINLDPRGYALKINQSHEREALSQTDWGGYGILAPEEI